MRAPVLELELGLPLELDDRGGGKENYLSASQIDR